VYDNRTSANFNIVPEIDIAEDGRARPNHNPVSDGWVALATFITSAAESDSLIEQDIVSNFGGFADDYTHAVIYKKPFADFRSRMYLNASQPSRKLRNHPGGHEPAMAIEKVAEAVD
jgi:hypothetical protein